MEQPHSARADAAATALVELTATGAGRRAVVTALICVRGALRELAELLKVRIYGRAGFSFEYPNLQGFVMEP